ncbi:MAG: cyclodeaminase/cyclohydrolase family protein [Deltaproteobacteria bacterium]|nr:cyclodeaminase/cyclohydrolase family protein [Deltaproteobacteria bacterium]
MKFAELSLEKILKELGAPSAAPGGGSAAALAGAIGASLCSMVAGLTLKNEKYRDSWKDMESIRRTSQEAILELCALAEKDMKAYRGVMEAYRLPRTNETEKRERQRAVQEALKEAARVPMEMLRAAAGMVEPLKVLLERGNPNCLTDTGVGIQLIDSAAKGAFYNIRINLSSITDKSFSVKMAEEAEGLSRFVEREIRELQEILEERLGSMSP